MSIKKKVSSNDLKEEKVLITCGATREYLDPIRFISNPSSGKMGLCLANEFFYRGADIKNNIWVCRREFRFLSKLSQV